LENLAIFLLTSNGKINVVDLDLVKAKAMGLKDVVAAIESDSLLPILDDGATIRTNAVINAYQALGFQA